MKAHQLSVKLFVKDGAVVQQDQLIPVFHGWIRDGRIANKLLIDVADYRHVHDGPGVMMIAHECHYAMDEAQGRTGLLYTRKRDAMGDAEAKLTEALADALEACSALEAEPLLDGAIRFNGSALQIRIMSRLVSSNDADGHAALRPTLNSVLGRLYPSGFSVRSSGFAQGPLQVDVEAEEAVDVDTLIARLGD